MDKEFETKEDMNIKENEEIINDKETTDESLDNTNETKKDYIKKEDTSSTDKDDNEDEYEKICYVCRRPESRAGKMVSMPGNIYVCTDCLQRSFDTMNDGLAGFPGFGGLNGMNVNISEEDLEKLLKMPNVRMITSDDFNREIPKNQKLKKKKKTEEKEVKTIDLSNLPAPHKIKEQLDEYVVGQDYAKKVMSVGVYNHYKRVANTIQDDVEIEKSNMLMIGPTGCGKTFLVKTLAKILDVPLAIADATSLTEAGYIGDDIESVLSKLLAAADNDVERAETGIVFIDEIDKLAKKQNSTNRDVSGESVQQGLLKLLEGSEVEVPVGATSKNAMVPLATVNTKNILFICGGAFPGLEDIIKERLNKQATIGFMSDLKDKYDKDAKILSKVTNEDLRKFGMIPEFIGRLPIIFTLEGLTEEMLVKILTEPRNAIIKQYKKLLAIDEVDLRFTEDALKEIAARAINKNTGARALRSIIEDFMLDIMYEIPKDDNIGTVTVTKECIEKKGAPIIGFRGQELLEQND